MKRQVISTDSGPTKAAASSYRRSSAARSSTRHAFASVNALLEFRDFGVFELRERASIGIREIKSKSQTGPRDASG